MRCVGTPADRFAEDALRILRALRFSAKLGFALDPATAAAALAARDTLRTVSAERLYTELDGLLLAPGAGQTLAQYGEILSGAVPEILPCIGCTQPGKWHCYDVWQHSAAAVGALDLRGQDTRGVRVLCWATFLHDIAKPLCRSVGPDGAAHFKGHNQRGAQLARVILRRLKAPAYLVDGAVGLIAVHDAPLPADDVGILKLLNRSGAIFLRRLCALKYADLDAHANTPEVAARRADVAAFERRMNELAKTGCYTMRQLAVNGADLMDIGIPAGPGVGATLQTLLNDVMEGTLPNEREALLAAAVKRRVSAPLFRRTRPRRPEGWPPYILHYKSPGNLQRRFPLCPSKTKSSTLSHPGAAAGPISRSRSRRRSWRPSPPQAPGPLPLWAGRAPSWSLCRTRKRWPSCPA